MLLAAFELHTHNSICFTVAIGRQVYPREETRVGEATKPLVTDGMFPRPPQPIDFPLIKLTEIKAEPEAFEPDEPVEEQGWNLGGIPVFVEKAEEDGEKDKEKEDMEVDDEAKEKEEKDAESAVEEEVEEVGEAVVRAGGDDAGERLGSAEVGDGMEVDDEPQLAEGAGAEVLSKVDS